MNILVTGSVGFIGSHLVRQLAGRPGLRVIVLDDLSLRGSTTAPELPNNVRFYRADISDAAVLREAIRGAEVVFHLAAISSVGALAMSPANGIPRVLGR